MVGPKIPQSVEMLIALEDSCVEVITHKSHCHCQKHIFRVEHPAEELQGQGGQMELQKDR